MARLEGEEWDWLAVVVIAVLLAPIFVYFAVLIVCMARGMF